MTIYSKFNIVYHLQKWMDSVPGQTFLNYAYSWGASVVILGTLFKLTHLPGANIMLFAGMGTEVFVFFISAFDRPFDKTQEGRDLPTHIDEEEIDREEAEAEAAYNAGVQGSVIIGGGAAGTGAGVAGSGAGVSGGGTIIIGGGTANTANVSAAPASEGATQTTVGGTQTIVGGTQTVVSPEAAQTAAAAAELAANHEVAMQLADAQANYLDELKRLTETCRRCPTRAHDSHATARRWRTSTAHSPASARYTRCSLRAQANRLALLTRSTSRASAWLSRLSSSTASMLA